MSATAARDAAFDLLEQHRADYLASARTYLAVHPDGTCQTTDDVRHVCPPPDDIDPRVMGVIFRGTGWHPVGFVNSKRGHGRMIRVFRKGAPVAKPRAGADPLDLALDDLASAHARGDYYQARRDELVDQARLDGIEAAPMRSLALDPKRATRTSRHLAHLLDLAKDGQKIAFVFPTIAAARQAFDHVRDLVPEAWPQITVSHGPAGPKVTIDQGQIRFVRLAQTPAQMVGGRGFHQVALDHSCADLGQAPDLVAWRAWGGR